MAETAEPNGSRDASDTSWVPKVDMEFKSEEEAYQFYNNYAREVGFGVRKAWMNRRASGLITSRTYVCYKEGFQRNPKEDNEKKSQKINERTGCLAHMIIKVTENRTYRVSEFHPMHNHELVPPDDAHLLKSHRAVKKRKTDLGSKPPQMSVIEYLVRRAGGYRQVTLYSVEDAANQSWAPKVDMEFENDEKAYQFYSEYGKKVGFDVRKAWVNRRASGVIFSRTYVCYKEGFYGNKKDISEVVKHKIHLTERTGCLARMIIKLANNGRYRVSEFESNHNHELVTAKTIHTLKSHRPPKKPEAEADNSASNAFLESSPSQHCKLLMPAKRNDSMKIGDAGAILQYMQARQADDPSFYYAVQLDEEERITTVFWADGKSKVDYDYFGDVICFDMTYKAGSYGRPFAPFYGVNHHKQIVFFGAALLFDETEESFKWLFQTFKTAMYGKQPRVILTDQNESVCSAIASVWHDTAHRACVWHIYHNTTKHLSHVFQASRNFACDFSRCLYDCEEEEEFTSSWEKMLEKYELKEDAWLNQLFNDRKKWALPYGREKFCADMKSTQCSVNWNNTLKEHLSQEKDLLHFFEHFESIINEHRQAEVQADFSATQGTLLIVQSRMLRQAANAYTPAVFDVFQREFELSMDCMVYKRGEVETMYEYKVTNEENSKEHKVKLNSLNDSITCSCKKFEFMGIQCRHVLKTLDILNVKELPPQYLLKRWRKDAKIRGGSLSDNHDFSCDVDPNLPKAQRCSSLSRILCLISAKAAKTLESYTFIENESAQLIDNINEILMTRPPEQFQFH